MHLLKTFVTENSLDLILDINCLTLWWFSRKTYESINLGKNQQTKSQLNSPGIGCLNLTHFFVVTGSHDSDTFSTPSSCASWSNTPLHHFEVGAVNWATDEIQRTITDTQPLQEDEDIPVARQNTPNTPSSLEVCLETNPRETVWNLSLPKITIGSRNLLKKINDAFLLPL